MQAVQVLLSCVCVSIVCSLQLVVTTYTCGRGKGKDHHEDTSERHGVGGYANHETSSPKTRESVEEMTEPGGGYGGDVSWQAAARPDVSEYDEFYEWYQGKWHTTEKSLYKSFLISEETTAPSSREFGISKMKGFAMTAPSRSWRGDSSPPDNEVTQSYIPIGYRHLGSNGTTTKKLTS